MDRVFPSAEAISVICAELVSPFKNQFDVIAAPATGGVVLSFESARQTAESGYYVSTVWADKKGDGFAFERAGFSDHLNGARVLMLEDLLTTGGSVATVCREAEKHGAEVVGVSAVCNRGGVTAKQLQVPRLESLTSVDFSAFAPEDCPLCKADIPIITNIGHGGDYQAKNPDYPGGYRPI